MKTLTVRYFAAFRERAGTDAETLEVDVESARDVFELTRDRHGSEDPAGHCKVAINDEMADWSQTVEDGDTILLFPPVAGG
ncbi:MAG: MoaD/ThiS family protein [Pseudomonadota bacterium]